MREIKAIQTEYNGYLFRSRLEARWAVFFDACGVCTCRTSCCTVLPVVTAVTCSWRSRAR